MSELTPSRQIGPGEPVATTAEPMVLEKFCRRCGIVTERKRYGKTVRCLPCLRRRSREYYAAHAPALRMKARQWYTIPENKAKRDARSVAWRNAHLAQARAISRRSHARKRAERLATREAD
jgi:hypothetical protein